MKRLVTMEEFRRLTDAVLQRRPVLRSLLEQHGHQPLFEYAQSYYASDGYIPNATRQQELIETFSAVVQERLGSATAKSAANQLHRSFVVSTADHHGPLVHPFFVNSNIVAASPLIEQHHPVLQNVIVLACANVSLGNSSFPRGLLVHADRTPYPLIRMLLSPARDRLLPVYGYPSYSNRTIEHILSRCEQLQTNATISDTLARKLREIIESVYAPIDVLSSRSYEHQITQTNALLWKRWWKQTDAPNLVYIDQESLVSRLLTEHHLHSETVINQILFDSSWHPFVQEVFNGITGAFDTNRGKGTFLFWLNIPSRGRMPLVRSVTSLQTPDGSYQIPLSPDAIAEGLNHNTLIPSTLLCSLVLAFYYGLRCLGGFSQVDYLTQMKKGYCSLMSKLGRNEDDGIAQRVPTATLCGDFTLAMLTVGESLVPATGIDLALSHDPVLQSKLLELTKNVHVEESLSLMMPEFYRIIYSAHEREPQLLSITSEDIRTLQHLDQRIPPASVSRTLAER